MRQIAAASLGRMPTTFERRFTALFSRSSGLFEQIFRQREVGGTR